MFLLVINFDQCVLLGIRLPLNDSHLVLIAPCHPLVITALVNCPPTVLTSHPLLLKDSPHEFLNNSEDHLK